MISTFLIGGGLFLLWVAYQIHKMQKVTKKLTIGNIWETKDGSIVIITNMRDPKYEYMIIVENKSGEGKECLYSTKGTTINGENASDALYKHIGTSETHPEYFL